MLLNHAPSIMLPQSCSWQILSLKFFTIYQVVATYIAQAFNEPEVVLRTKKQK